MTNVPLFEHDRDLGARYVCGADEAGRACMAGPLVAAAVRLDYARLDAAAIERLAELNDSKQVTARRRAELLSVLYDVADAVAFVVVPPGQIDRDGLHVSNLHALRRALESVAVAGSANLVDAYDLKGIKVAHHWMERGDGRSAAIAAASIVAKETRDGLMRRLDADHPGYGFAVHKGYITPAHEAAVVELGLSPAHRRSVRCKAYAALDLCPPVAATARPRAVVVPATTSTDHAVGLTPHERELIDRIGSCHRAFEQLEAYNPADAEEFAVHVHALGRIVLSRVAIRAHPTRLRPGGGEWET